ncbi:MAG: hypothetical protein ACREN8_01115 [Candidatus Dormibacteraceae bacterium]
MIRLANKLGDHFLGGVLLYTGTRAYNFQPRIHVVPLDRLWKPAAA